MRLNSDEDFVTPLPVAENVEMFLEHPELYSPQLDFLTLNYLDDETVLTHAIKSLNTVAVKSLLDAGADPNFTNNKGVTPMSGAAHKGNIQIMQYLLDAGADVNLVNQSGSTALIQASHFGWDEAVRFLLRNHAYADFTNSKGTTALMRSAQEGHLVISEVLIHAGADVNKKNNEGMNALMLASQRGHASMVMLLIQNGALMDDQTSQGSTALMLACKRGNENVVEALVSMGAEIFIRDARGRTALDTAIKRQHTPLLGWLDTQVQKRRVAENCHRLRTKCLMEMRRAHQKRRLQLSLENQKALAIVRAVKLNDYESLQRASSADYDMSFAVHSISTLLNSPAPVVPVEMVPRPVDYADWMWPLLLFRCMDLPEGVFETIIEYMPLPRIWHWSLLRLKRRCRFAPKQAVNDLCIMLDEMLSDFNIFRSPQQTLHLVRISRREDVQKALVSVLRMPPALVDSLCVWSDVQSLNARTGDAEVLYKPQLAMNLMNLTVEMFRHYRDTSMSSIALCLSRNGKSKESTLTAALRSVPVPEVPMVSESAAVDDEEDLSDNEAMMDQDSESEGVAEEEGELGALDDDEDAAGGNQHLLPNPQLGYNLGL